MSPEILAAFFVGLFGSFHCIGMCGPIAIALPVPNSNNLSFVTGRLLYNLGREIRTLVSETQSAGTYEVNFDASEFPSGVYIYKIQAGNFAETKKLILMK